ncbi:hypothetical protein F1640_18480 [Novosphingobium sp. NBM11]|uniref:hypothetical protein n=1 Tax=Novosphingobium sp. NBM11 TaxID=2596914 RepID=UPI0018921318|nr:hypothetical protein [Novosphingobium sp. NBM11]MBF5091943.1 hypothetical protein [Novosphingobium sp. NBM11]
MSGQRFAGVPVPGIEPVKGWTLMEGVEEDGDGFRTRSYFARGRVSDVLIQHSRFRFTPTQERFAFLAVRGFPRYIDGHAGPITDDVIDRAIENDLIAVSRFMAMRLREQTDKAVLSILSSVA